MSEPNDLLTYVPLPDPWGLGLAAVLGAFWMLVLAPTGWWRASSVWLFVGLGITLFPPSIAWVQVPLQMAAGAWLFSTFGREALVANPLAAAVPGTLLSGLVQEAAKLLPLLVYVLAWRPRGARRLLQAGAAVGLGFGAVEAAWIFGTVFAAGWTIDTARAGGVMALFPFIERFFAVGFHAATGVILAYGLARGMAPLMFAVAALLHAVLNYGVVLARAGLLGIEGVELYIAFWALVAISVAVGLSRRALRAEQHVV